MLEEDTMDSDNARIADRLDEVAQVLEEQQANPYRVRAYRRGAAVVRGLALPARDLLRTGGLAALESLPDIGETLARAVRDLALTGHLPMLERLRGAGDPVGLLRTVPGIGRGTAARIHDDLGIESLEELETAAHDGRLSALLGLGPKRLAGIRESLAQRLGRIPRPARGKEPPVDELLDVDAEYRARAAAGTLPLIAPRRFNPDRAACLPVMHAARGKRHYTAVFSNTARAHRAGATRDWVVLYVEGGGVERRYTVITARHGPRRGQRVVMGREEQASRAEPREYLRAG
jgi:hypothetical protein